MLGLLIQPDGQVSAVEVRRDRQEIDRLLGGGQTAYRDFTLPGGTAGLRIFYAEIPRLAGSGVNYRLAGLLGGHHFAGTPLLPGLGIVLRMTRPAGGENVRRLASLTINDCLAIATAIVRNERLELEG
jgi:hypothetical protein